MLTWEKWKRKLVCEQPQLQVLQHVFLNQSAEIRDIEYATALQIAQVA